MTASESVWGEAYGRLSWLPGGRLNIAHETIDRHANGRLRDKPALVWQGMAGERESYTFGQLKRLTSQFAHVLLSLGIQPGDPVFTYMTRVPEMYVALLGIMKAGAVAAPQFSGLAPAAVKERLKQTGAKVLVTQPEHRRRMASHIPELWELQHIVVVDRADRDTGPIDIADLNYGEEMDKSPLDFDTAPRSQYDPALLHYTSGATGEPKGVLHAHLAVAQHCSAGSPIPGLVADDVVWCTADPGWTSGTAYGMLAPWANGATLLVFEGGFDAGAWCQAIQRNRVTVWYTAPAALEMLMGSGEDLVERFDKSSLRHVFTMGGGVEGRTADWAERLFGTAPRNTWAQTETGAVLIADQGSDTPSGSLGRPVPEIEAAILDDDYNALESASAMGRLALRPGWPSMFRGYWGDEGLYNSRFRKGWYLSGDLVRRDEDGLLWFEGRVEDEE